MTALHAHIHRFPCNPCTTPSQSSIIIIRPPPCIAHSEQHHLEGSCCTLRFRISCLPQQRLTPPGNHCMHGTSRIFGLRIANHLDCLLFHRDVQHAVLPPCIRQPHVTTSRNAHYRVHTCICIASRCSCQGNIQGWPNTPPWCMSAHCTGITLDTPRADTARASGPCTHRLYLTAGQPLQRSSPHSHRPT